MPGPRESVPSAPRTDSLLSDGSRERPDRPALLHDEVTLTYRELTAAVDRLAAAVPVQPGERVVVVAPNAPALVVAMFAAWRVGAVAVPLSARLRRFELERAVSDAQPAAAVSIVEHGGFPFAEELGAIAERSDTLGTCLVVDDAGALLDDRRWSQRDRAPAIEPEIAAILYTSGTTGEPKGALVSHALATAMAANLAEVLGGEVAGAYGLPVPASHAYGLGCLLGGLAAGGAAVLAEVTTSLDPLLGALQRHAATVLHGTPALFGRLLRTRPELTVRLGFTAGSWCPPDLLEALDRQGVQVLNLYGMTELGAACSCRREDAAPTRYHTVGRPLPGYELRLAGAEIQVRCPYLPPGYHGRAWGADERTGDGWFRTGDLGELDPAGNLTISGRAKEVVHVGGFNVFPAEVESFLLTHPAIAQAAVLGVPHRALGEALQAFVVPAPGAKLEPREVVGFARAGIAGYKVPYAVRVVDELPLLASGKPDRRALAESTAPTGAEASAGQPAVRG